MVFLPFHVCYVKFVDPEEGALGETESPLRGQVTCRLLPPCDPCHQETALPTPTPPALVTAEGNSSSADKAPGGRCPAAPEGARAGPGGTWGGRRGPQTHRCGVARSPRTSVDTKPSDSVLLPQGHQGALPSRESARRTGMRLPRPRAVGPLGQGGCSGRLPDHRGLSPAPGGVGPRAQHRGQGQCRGSAPKPVLPPRFSGA